MRHGLSCDQLSMMALIASFIHSMGKKNLAMRIPSPTNTPTKPPWQNTQIKTPGDGKLELVPY